MNKKQIPTQTWHAAIVAVVLAIALPACQTMPAETPASEPAALPTAEPTQLPTPRPTAHSSPDMVMQAMIERAARGDDLAFSELLAYDTMTNLAKMAAIVAHCTGRSTLDVPFDVEYEQSTLEVGQIGNLAGLYTVYMERFDGEWFISEIQGTLEECLF